MLGFTWGTGEHEPVGELHALCVVVVRACRMVMVLHHLPALRAIAHRTHGITRRLARLHHRFTQRRGIFYEQNAQEFILAWLFQLSIRLLQASADVRRSMQGNLFMKRRLSLGLLPPTQIV